MNLAMQRSQTEGVSLRYVNNNNNGGSSFPFKSGDFFTATITGKTDKKTSLHSVSVGNTSSQALDHDGYTFDVAAGSVKGEVGQQVSFQVLKNDDKGLVLKQVFNREETLRTANAGIKQQALSDIKDLLKQNHIIKEENVLKPEDRTEEQIKAMKAIAKIRRQLTYPGANASLNAVNELAAAGLSLNKITLPLLNSVMKEIEAKPVKQITPEELSRIVDEYFSKAEAEEERDRDILKALVSNDLPATVSNIKSLKKTLRQVEEVEDLNEGAIAKLIQNETPLTLESLYIARFSSNSPAHGASSRKASLGRERITPEALQSLMPEIYKAFEREAIENTAENRTAARFLVKNDCPVTKENMQKLDFLQNAGKRINRQELLFAAAQNIKQDKQVMDIPLYNQDTSFISQTEELYENYCQIIEVLPEVTVDDISDLIQQGHTLTLDTFKNIYAKDNEEVRVVQSVDSYSASLKNASAEAITAKRQLMEIAVKLTHEAAYRLSRQGIRIDTAPLSQALESLKALELDSYGRNLRAMQGDASYGIASLEERKTAMFDLYEKLAVFKPELIRQGVSGEILSQKVGFTINGVHAYLKEVYEQQQLPNSRYGDSFEKVEGQMASLLERLGIEASPENLRVASILSRNERDVTEENIAKIKVIDYKLTRLANRLHPNIAAKMINEGHNPVEMPIDEVLDYIKGFENIYGVSLKDRLTENILKLDESGSISREVREPMIAMYRMMNMIEKNGGAALGVALGGKANPTLGDLMEASRFYSKTQKGVRFDYTVDDNFGRLDRLNRPESGVRNLLDSRRPSKAGEEYRSQLLTSLGELGTPDALQNLLQRKNSRDQTLEEIVGELTDNKEQVKGLDKETAASHTRQLQNLSNVSPTVLQTLASYDIPPTLDNIFAMQNLDKYVSTLRNVINELKESEEKDALIAEIPDSGLESWIEGADPSGVLDSVSERIDELKETLMARTQFQQLNTVQNTLRLQRTMLNSGTSLRLPVKLRDGISSLNLYIVNKEVRDEMKIFMSLDTRAFGEVQAQIVTNGESAEVLLSTGTKQELAALQEGSGRMEGYLEDVPIQLKKLRFAVKAEGETLLDKNEINAPSKTGSKLSFQNASTKNIKKLVSAVVRLCDI